MNKKSFTLVELIVVILIIGILAVIAIPQYMTALERTRVGKAKSMLGMIMQAEKLYSTEHSGNYSALISELQNYVEVANSDSDWVYTCTAAPLAQGARTAGVPTYSGSTVTLDGNGTWGGDHPLK